MCADESEALTRARTSSRISASVRPASLASSSIAAAKDSLLRTKRLRRASAQQRQTQSSSDCDRRTDKNPALTSYSVVYATLIAAGPTGVWSKDHSGPHTRLDYSPHAVPGMMNSYCTFVDKKLGQLDMICKVSIAVCCTNSCVLPSSLSSAAALICNAAASAANSATAWA